MKRRAKRANDVLTVEEIKSRYDSEWILLSDPKVNSRQEVISGRLLFHSKDRDQVYRKAIELKPKHSAFLYTGRMPDDMAYVL